MKIRTFFLLFWILVAPSSLLAQKTIKLSNSTFETTYRLTPLMDACLSGDVQNVRKQLGLNPNINEVVDGETALRYAAGYIGNENIVKLLIEAGADVRLCTGELGWCPLHVAAATGDLRTVQLLVQAGARVSARSSQLDGNRTAEQVALAHKRKEVVSYFHQLNGKTKSPDSDSQ